MKLSGDDMEEIHWRTLRLELPEHGVGTLYDTEEQCRASFARVRWPEGAQCPRCGASGPTRLASRHVYQCEKCRHQFSETSGSALHRTRISLRTWFVATEIMILRRTGFGQNRHVTTDSFAKNVGLQYVAAHRMKRIIIADLSRSDGLLRQCVCCRRFSLPDGVQPLTVEHLMWLIEMSYAG
ncbi:transposase [Falsirhodobacter sp. 1013]|uniref:transposase n=1 Tax=Falsirhodobacter sp. 1013 TaxID=3417566 RepID=UPI003EBB087F